MGSRVRLLPLLHGHRYVDTSGKDLHAHQGKGRAGHTIALPTTALV